MEAVIAYARRHERATVTLDTGAANAAARGFYRSLGFEEEDVKLTLVLRQ